jgi:phosphotransferase system enzyme I (PtsI)
MRELRGLAASNGIAIGPAFLFKQVETQVARYQVEDKAAEIERLSQALKHASQELDSIYHQALAETGNEIAAIFQFHILMLEDVEFIEKIHAKIETDSINAEAALKDAGEEFARILEGMEDEYFRARALDIKDVVGRVTRILLKVNGNGAGKLVEPSIVIAQDLTPSDTITLDKSLVLGFCIAQGGPTSHTAILARELGLPAIVGLGADLLEILDGSRLILDGNEGILIVDPNQEDLVHYQALHESMRVKVLKARQHAQEPVYTKDGRRIEVAANIGSVAGAKNAVDFGAEGVGLLRTEFIYLGRTSLPTEDEQFQIYREIAEVFGDKPVILRTLDIGGDKEVPYLDLPKEANPFLGVRGLRLCLAKPDLFEPQLKAALRVRATQNLKIMFPMVTNKAEIRLAKALLEKCRQDLIRENKPVAEHIETGIMVEVPAVAVMADQLADEVDFFSIGTNDLSQYVMAADRTNNAVSPLAESLSPAILRLVQEVVRAAHAHGKWAGMCGELAGEPLAIPILLGLGLDEFSMNAPTIPLAKQIIRSLSLEETQQIAKAALQLEDAQAVKAFVKAQFPGIYA